MRIRIGNDFEYAWVLENSEDSAPIDLNTAIGMTVTARVHRVRVNVPYEIVDNDTLLFKFDRSICGIIGDYNLELNYFSPDTSLAPKDREKTIDIDAFTIVSRTAQADDVKFITSTSDIAMAFKGDKGDPFTYEDFTQQQLDDIQQPITDFVAVAEVAENQREENEDVRVDNENIRISNESDRGDAEITREQQETDRQANTATAISNANTATSQADIATGKANTARDEAVIATSDARDAISETETATSDANVATGKTNTATTQANTARDNANASALNADEKATLAETAAQNANNATSDFSDAELIREQQEQARQANTATAITNAENAITDVNTAKDDYYDVVKPDIIAQGEYAQAQGNYAKAQGEAIQDDLALKADKADLVQLESDVEQLAYVKIKDEVVNGNFANGLITPFSKLDGGEGASTLAINSSNPISGNYDARFAITTPSTASNRPILSGLHRAGNIGEKIYLHFYAKILSGIPIIDGVHNGITRDTIYRGDVINGRNTRIIDVMDTAESLGTIYFDSRAVWDMQMDNFMRINLTETFGAGNEPTKEEMDLLISTLDIDYFEGEITVPVQKIMQWHLAMIQQNRNAIIALGGTII